ncbi:hypothetical protein KFU94_40705 [Chloroflexi bacterium TSY]|nr:hypothetical protein [Chloroflexi bacterium TSY]
MENNRRVDYNIWVRQEKVHSWRSGNVSNEERYFYQPHRQGNVQLGNVAQVQEWADGVKLRQTNSWYYPNRTRHIINRPARIPIEGSTCLSEERMVYDGVGRRYHNAPTQGLLTKRERLLKGSCTTTTIGSHDTTTA